MTHKTFAETIDERREAVDLVVSLIMQRGSEADLRDLHVLLVNVMSLMKRDPGLEFAADDLYLAAGSFIRESSCGTEATPRMLRLLRDARERFGGRLSGAVVRVGALEGSRYCGFEAAYAVQLERDGGDRAWERSAA